MSKLDFDTAHIYEIIKGDAYKRYFIGWLWEFSRRYPALFRELADA